MSDHLPTAEQRPEARYPFTACSSCGGVFGPGNSGFSHCFSHKGRPALSEEYAHQQLQLAARFFGYRLVPIGGLLDLRTGPAEAA